MAENLALMFIEQVHALPHIVMQYSKNADSVFVPTTYGQLLEEVASFSAGLVELGVAAGNHIGLIADNRKEWLISDLAILGLGAADVPRGCDATEQELAYILSWSECSLAVLENERQLMKLVARKSELPRLATAILFDAPSASATEAAGAAGIKVLLFADVFAAGARRRAAKPGEYEAAAARVKRDDVATIIYTSGTTGEPKGVMLSHANFMHQTEVLPEIIDLKPGQIWLSVLPVWHSFERIVQYAIIAVHDSIAYSKPIGAIMLPDFQAIQPDWMASVPRIWESVKDGIYRNIRQSSPVTRALFTFFVWIGESFSYLRNMMFGLLPDFGNRSRMLDAVLPVIPLLILAPFRGLGELLVFRKIKTKLGGNFKAGISGGGAMPASVDIFFNAIGVQILEGYGLTETAPVIGLRPQRKPVMGTVGPAIRGTEFKLLDEAGHDVGTCTKGVVHVKGPQVMLGYYKKPELTAQVLSSDGWLNTGDLGMLTTQRFLKLTGRAKDTIVLLGGENVEPLPIEQRICDSQYISQAVVLGQDQRFLVALIIPNQDAILAWAKDNTIPIVDYETLLAQAEIKELIDYEINQAVNAKTGFKSFERIFRFELLAKPFEVGTELSAKQEVKRHVVAELYKHQINRMFRNA